jgi:two-component system, sensor histidine kinase and response regulator
MHAVEPTGKMNVFTLAFRGDIEKAFQDHYYSNTLNQVRVALLLGLILYSLFGLLDLYLLPGVKEKLWLIRFAVFAPLVTLVYLLSFSRYSRAYLSRGVFITVLAAGFGILAMIVIAQSSGLFSYYAGLILILIYLYTFIRLRFVWATVAGWIVVAGYEVVAIWLCDTPVPVMVNNNFFFLSANLLGMVACYSMELYARRDFLQARLLETERERLHAENLERRRVESELRENQELFRRFSASVTDIVYRYDLRKNRFDFLSASIETHTGYTSRELEEDPICAFVGLMHPDDVNPCLEKIGTFLANRQGNGPLIVDYRVRKKNGDVIWVSDHMHLESSPGGEPICINGVIRNMTEAKRLEEEMTRARVAAEGAAATKSEFLANVSHEIRTPMNGILGMIQLLAHTALNPEQRDYLETARFSADSLLSLVNDILDFSKIEAGRMELETLDFDLRECVENALNAMAPRAHEKGLELVSEIPQDLPERVEGDPARLRQVLTNLVNNAVKFTETGEILVRMVPVRTAGTHTTVRFEVRDTGIGISPEGMQRLFQPFSQEDASTTRKYGGTGLGLAISKRLVEAMGGTIQAESRPGQGALFSFTAVFGRRDDGNGRDQEARMSVPGGLRVLIVEGPPSGRTALGEILRGWNYEVEEADKGGEALNRLRKAAEEGRPFHMACIDYDRVREEGDDLVRRIGTDLNIAGVPLVLLTSLPRRGEASRIPGSGPRAVLSKPLRQSKLFDTLADLLGMERRPDRLQETVPGLRGLLKNAGRDRFRVLLVEDNRVNQKVACRMLEKTGCRCDVASNGQEALEAMSFSSYDMVLMDCQMPMMDGYETTAAIRRREGGDARVPIVAMTAHAMKGDREKCLDAGMDDYLAKPVTVSELNRVLDRFLPRNEPFPSS